jgi:hypothetical protein
MMRSTGFGIIDLAFPIGFVFVYRVATGDVEIGSLDDELL